MRKIYNKLVRDRIPEIIEKDGKTCITSHLSLGEYQMALDAKLGEEVKEYAESLDIHDAIKNKAIEASGIPFLRLKTNGDSEKEQITALLDRMV